jgi:HAD superfamily hydrolase (TIGR01509 family)
LPSDEHQVGQLGTPRVSPEPGVTALILDCDGVLAETERDLHLPAFNQAFKEFNVPVAWSDAEYAEKLRVAGGKERIASSFSPAFAASHGLPVSPEGQQDLFERLHARKTQIFAEMLEARPLAARPGVLRILRAANEAGWKLAIASTSAQPAVEAVARCVLGRAAARRLAIFAGDIVRAKKPDPAIYELAVERLGTSKDETIVIEDTRNGLLAANSAGLPCVVTVSEYSAADTFSEAALVLSSLGDPDTPMTVLANRTTVSPLGYLRLSDLTEILTGRRGRGQ